MLFAFAVEYSLFTDFMWCDCDFWQVSQMKHDYEKLHRCYVRHNHDRHKDCDQTEVKKMSAKLEVENCLGNVIVKLVKCLTAHLVKNTGVLCIT